MEKKPKIVQYRERLDKTLASPDLTNDEMLKTLVKSQLRRSSKQEIQEYKEKLVETKTAEVSNLLHMLRSASVDERGGSSTSRTDWKLKQDNEEFRVMYREGPEGTPFHTLLVEGYVDGPVDVCLCISWQTSLYKKWWPHFTVPTFKVIAADCLQKVQTGEQISLVRMKMSWPLSTREAIVHYYLFEYFQDDLIVVILNSVPESKSINGTINGFNYDAIPEAKDVVRIDLVGGFVLQKVTSERSYFRTIANMDIKLDFVPPSLINFISRQLIGSGFRLYQKAVASMMSHDKGLSESLGDSLYVRIREALYSISGSKDMNGEELKQVASILPAEDHAQSMQDGAKDISWEDRSNQYANNCNGEIVEEDSEEIVEIEEDDKIVQDIPIEEVDTRSVLKGKRNVYVSSEVKQALETLERAISVVRKCGFHSRKSSSSFANEESRCMEKGGTVDSYSAELIQLCSKNEVSVEVSNGDIVEETAQEEPGTLCSKNEVSVEVSNGHIVEETAQEEPGTNFDIQNFRHTGAHPSVKEVNFNKVVPASPEQNLSRPIETSQVASYSLKNGTALDQTTCNNKQLSADDMSSYDPKMSDRQRILTTIVAQGISSDVPKKSSRRKKYIYCCFKH